MNHDLAPSAWRYARRRGVPLIAYVWDVPPFRLGTGTADHVFSVAGRLVTVPRLGRRYATRRGYYSRLRYVATHAAAVWTPSAASARDVESRFGVAAQATPYCYDSRLFAADLRRRRSGVAAADQMTLLSVSRLTPPKNQAAVLRAAAQLGARVELVGRGPTQPDLERLAKELRVPCRIRAGLSADELIATYQQASVVACPSRFEGLGLTGIEAAICGTPVAASDIPTHREFLGSAASFFTLDDDAGMSHAIRRAYAAGSPETAHFAHLTIEAAAQRFRDGILRQL